MQLVAQTSVGALWAAERSGQPRGGCLLFLDQWPESRRQDLKSRTRAIHHIGHLIMCPNKTGSVSRRLFLFLFLLLFLSCRIMLPWWFLSLWKDDNQSIVDIASLPVSLCINLTVGVRDQGFKVEKLCMEKQRRVMLDPYWFQMSLV